MTETFARLTPTAAAAYLVTTGWLRIGERNAGTAWARPLDSGVGNLFQPEDVASPDYALRVGEMLAALAVAEDRSESAILADLCAGDQPTGIHGDEKAAARRTDWMEPEYGLRRPELALVLDLAASRVERHTFVLELERLQWPLSEAAELADLVAECELTAAESAPATEKAAAVQAEYERMETAARTLAARVGDLEAVWRSSGRNLEVAAHQLGDPKARAMVAVLKARDALRAAAAEEGSR